MIRCYHRLLDLRGKHVDVEVLRILVKGIGLVQVCNDATSLRDPALKLFGRLTSQVQNHPATLNFFSLNCQPNENSYAQVLNNAEIWKLYADLVATKENKTLEDYSKIINNLQKAYRVATQDPGWERTVEQCKTVINWCIELAEGDF